MVAATKTSTRPVFAVDRGPTRKPRIKPLNSYVPKNCLHKLWMDRTGDPSLKKPDSAFTKQLKLSGIDFEDAETAVLVAHSDTYVVEITADTTERQLAKAAAAALKHRIVVIRCDDSKYANVCNEAVTHHLLESRAAGHGACEVVWNGALRSWRHDGKRYVWGVRSGKPDVLVWLDEAWVPVDVKFHKVLSASKKSAVWTMSPMWDPNARYSAEATGSYNHDDAMQLCHYVRMMEFHSIPTTPYGGIIGKATDEVDAHSIVWIELDGLEFDRGSRSALEDYDDAFAEALVVARQASRGKNPEPVTWVEWKSECSTCPWRDVCLDEAKLADELTLMPGMSVNAARTLRSAGIDTVAKLATVDHTTAAIVEAGAVGLSAAICEANTPRSKRRGHLHTALVCDDLRTVEILGRHGIETISQLAGLDATAAALPRGLGGRTMLTNAIDQARVFDHTRRRSEHVFLRRGVARLVLPDAPVELHVDMEEDGLIYLWGVRTEVRSKRMTTTEYRPFVSFDNTPQAEAKVFAAFWAYLTKTIADGEAQHGPGSVKVYHYTAAEDRCMKHLAKSHEGADGVPTLAEVEEFLNSDTWYDLYPVLAKDVIWPLKDHTLKSLAKYARFTWRDSDPSGADSTVWYRNACDAALSDDERAAWQDRLLKYNEDDVHATSALLAFFRQMLSVYDPASKLQSVSELDVRYRRKRRV